MDFNYFCSDVDIEGFFSSAPQSVSTQRENGGNIQKMTSDKRITLQRQLQVLLRK